MEEKGKEKKEQGEERFNWPAPEAHVVNAAAPNFANSGGDWPSWGPCPAPAQPRWLLMASQSGAGEEAPHLQRALRRGSCPLAERDGAGFAKCLAQKGRQTAPGSSVQMSTVAFPFRGIEEGRPRHWERKGRGAKWSGEAAGAGQLPQKETEAGRMAARRRKRQRPKDAERPHSKEAGEAGCLG